MFKGLAGMASMMGNLQHLPAKLEAINERMRAERVQGESSDGLVTVIMNGLGEMQAITLEPGVLESGVAADASPGSEVDPGGDEHRGQVEQSICEATNQASAEAKRLFAQAVHETAKEMNLNVPGLESLLTRMTGGSGG